MNFFKKLFNFSTLYYYEKNKLFVHNKKTREIKSILQFGVSATSYFYEMNQKLLNIIFNEDINFFYLSDDGFEAQHKIIPFLEDKLKQPTLTLLQSLENGYVALNNEKIDFECVEFAHNNNKNIFFIPKNGVARYDSYTATKFKESLFLTLEYFQKCTLKKTTFLAINILTNNFTSNELNKIHSIIKDLQNKDIICITCMADYGQSLNFINNFFGEEDYDEYWMWNFGEGIEIKHYLPKINQMPFFNSLPKILQHNLISDSDFLKNYKKHFESNFFNSGHVIFSKNKWFFQKI